MVRWNWWARVCVIVFSLSAFGELLAEEAGQQPKVGGQVAVAEKAAGRDAAMRGAIEGVLRSQQEAWNGGDVRAFRSTIGRAMI
jgi:hypothetical protein